MQETLSREVSPLEQLAFPSIESTVKEIADLETTVNALQSEVDTLLPAEKRAAFASKLEAYLKSEPDIAVGMLNRIKETDIFRDIDSVGLETALNSKKSRLSALRTLFMGRRTEKPFITDSSIQHIDNSAGYDAKYENQKIKTSASDISANAVLLELTMNGALPSGVRDILHESIHKKQHQDLQRTHKIKTQNIPNTILYEALARRGGDYPISSFESVPPKVMAELSYATALKGSGNYYSSEKGETSRPEILEEWKSAFEVIDLLQACDVPVGKISEMIETLSELKKSSPDQKSVGLLQFVQTQLDQRLNKMNLDSEEKKSGYIESLRRKKHLEAREKILTTRKLLLQAFSQLP